MNYWKLGIPLFFLIVLAMVSPAFADAPTGASPRDPLRVTGTWQTIAPNTSLWFYFDYGGDRSLIQVLLQNHQAENVRLAVYTPALARDWQTDPSVAPVGLGARPGETSQLRDYDLAWQGAFNFPGRFFAVVANDNPKPIPFRLTITGTNITLAPTATPTRFPTPLFTTPVPVASLQGKIVFQEASGGGIYTVNGDGSGLLRVAYGLDPAWSPDGKQIAFARWDEPAGLYIANADGSNVQSIFAAAQVLSPQWSSDGTRIVFAQQKGGPPETVTCIGNVCTITPADPYWKIGVIEIAMNRLTEPPSSKHSFAPTWSNDDRYIAYADAGFGILRTDTQSPVRVDPELESVPNPLTMLYNQTPRVQAPVWSPDGSKIAFQVLQHDHWEILVMNADGSGVTAVTRPIQFSLRAVNNVAPAWSPDGKEILFLSDRNGKWEFFAVHVDGSNLRQVLKNVTDTIALRYNFSNERVMDWR